MLLRDLARLQIRLVANHPDGHDGLAFVGRYPNTCATCVLAASCVVGAAIPRQVLEAGMDVATYGYIISGWLIIVLALFAVPLMAFRIPVIKLRDQTSLASGAQATQHFRALEREVLGGNIRVTAAAESQTVNDTPDPSKIFGAAQKLKTLPFSRDALLPISAAALIPMVAAGATQLPFKEIITDRVQTTAVALSESSIVF